MSFGSNLVCSVSQSCMDIGWLTGVFITQTPGPFLFEFFTTNSTSFALVWWYICVYGSALCVRHIIVVVVSFYI